MSLFDYMNTYSLYVDEYVAKNFGKEPKILYQASSYIINQGGKRQRPFILISSGQMFNGQVELMIPAAAAIELLHNFTLIHDDIMDNDEERRGVPTVHMKYGIPMAILAGDLIFAKSFESALNLIQNAHYSCAQIIKITQALTNASVEVCEGQALDLQIANSKEFPSKEEYYRLVELKTSSLFKACTIMGSTLAGADPYSIELMCEFGRLYGLCFQLVDDVLGVTGNPSVIGKPVGNDVREGKKTIIVKYVLENISKQDKRSFLSILGDKNASAEKINEALSIIRMSKAPQMVRAEAKSISEKAIKILEGFPKSQARDMLITLTLEASARSK